MLYRDVIDGCVSRVSPPAIPRGRFPWLSDVEYARLNECAHVVMARTNEIILQMDYRPICYMLSHNREKYIGASHHKHNSLGQMPVFSTYSPDFLADQIHPYTRIRVGDFLPTFGEIATDPELHARVLTHWSSIHAFESICGWFGLPEEIIGLIFAWL